MTVVLVNFVNYINKIGLFILYILYILRANTLSILLCTYSGKLFGRGDSTPSVFTPINLSNTAFAAACFASFLDLPVPIAETIGSASE